MGVTFLQPWVWLLAAAAAVPVVIHLLERNRSRRLSFPSLRFLESTRLSSTRFRRLQDIPLLCLRVAIVLAAVMALAQPVFITPARQDAWSRRTARAVVVDEGSASAEDELRSAAVGAAFARERASDAIRDAVRWLKGQEPPVHELVVLSSFRRGAVAPADLAHVPETVGIRLVRASNGTAVRERETARLELRDEGLVRVTERLTLAPSASQLEMVRVEPVREPPIAVTAPDEDRARAEAALRAVLRRGVRLPPAGLMQPLSVTWHGDVRTLAADIDGQVSASLEAWEPETMTDEELAVLSRPVPPVERVPPQDMGDRRLVWALVLGLLAAETWIRKEAA